MNERHCKLFKITGRVQGVFFRQQTRTCAQKLGLRGWVRNCADGSVETMACGEAKGLAEFAAWLAHGPAAAKVEKVTSRLAQPDTPLDNFAIRSRE